MAPASGRVPPAQDAAFGEAGAKPLIDADLLLSQRQFLAAARLMIENDVSAVVDLIANHAFFMIQSGRNQELQDVIAVLPPQQSARPIVAIWLAYARLPYEPSRTRKRLEEIRLKLQPRLMPVEYALAITGEVQSTLSDWSEYQRLPPLIEAIDSALPDLKDLPDEVRARLIMARCTAMLLGWPTHPQVDQACQQIEAAMPALSPGGQLLVGGALLNHLIWWRGDLTRARPYLDNLEVLARRGDMPPLAILVWYYGALSFAYREGDMNRLQVLLDEAVTTAEQNDVTHRLSNAYWVAAQAYADDGDLARAKTMVAKYSACAPEKWRRADLFSVHYLRGVLALCVDDSEAVISEAEQGRTYAVRYGGSHQVALHDMLLARALAAKGDPRAPRYIAAVQQAAETADNANFRLQAAFASAHLAYQRQDAGCFVDAWQSMVDIALRLGWRQITGLPREIAAMLANKALHDGAAVTSTSKLISLWGLPSPARGMVHDAWPYSVQIRSLGNFEIHIDGRRLKSGERKAPRKPLELLWHLLAGAENNPQEALADMLWPELDGDKAIHVLRTTLYRLRLLLGSRAVRHENDHIGLDLDYVRTDVHDLRVALDQAGDKTAHDDVRLDAFDRIMRLYRGPFLPGIQLDAVQAERRRIQAKVVSEGWNVLRGQNSDDLTTDLRLKRLRAAAPEHDWTDAAFD